MISTKEFNQKREEIIGIITIPEQEFINEIEKYIDSIIKDKINTFDSYFEIDASYIKGDYGPLTRITKFNAASRERIKNAILDMYTKGGWIPEINGAGSMTEEPVYKFKLK